MFRTALQPHVDHDKLGAWDVISIHFGWDHHKAEVRTHTIPR